MDTQVPLVVPEINAEDVKWHKGIIANPNCTTAITLMALYPLHQGIYGEADLRIELPGRLRHGRQGAGGAQKASGADRAGPSRSPRKSILTRSPSTYLPHVDSFLASGYTKEEMKMENEGRKIMHHPGFRASVTCVRVPVYRAHSIGGQRRVRETCGH